MREKLSPTLYHGTSMYNWRRIKSEGLDPERSESEQDAVYLAGTRRLAEAFASRYSGVPYLVVEIDAAALDPSLFAADLGIELAQKVFLDDEDEEAEESNGKGYADLSWRESLDLAGQVAYLGHIPAEAIQVVHVDDMGTGASLDDDPEEDDWDEDEEPERAFAL